MNINLPCVLFYSDTMICSSFSSSFRKKPAPEKNDHISFILLYFCFHLAQNNVSTAKKLVEQKNKSITKFQSSHKRYEKVSSQRENKKISDLLRLILSPLPKPQ